MLSLVDGTFPSGGFAYSWGLESLARLGHLRSTDDLEHTLEDILAQAATVELPFLGAAWRADTHADLRPLQDRLNALFILPGLRRASCQQGKAWLGGLSRSDLAKARPELWDAFRNEPASHAVVVFGALTRTLDLEEAAAALGWLYALLRDQVGSLVRLGLIGPLEGQGLLQRQLTTLPALADGPCAAVWRTTRRSTALLDVAQTWHPSLYSRLFQN